MCHLNSIMLSSTLDVSAMLLFLCVRVGRQLTSKRRERSDDSNGNENLI